MLKSNISIISNIYIRSDPDIRKDRKYTEKITGAKRLRDINKGYFGFEKIRLTPVQEKIISENQNCSFAKNGEKPFGAVIVDGEMQWVNRCEYTACPRYESCTSGRVPKLITRDTVKEYVSEEKKSLHEFFEKLGIIIQEDEVVFERDRNTAKAEEPKKYKAAAEQQSYELKESGNEYIEIEEPEHIITAPLDSHIILNSGPGTGKTYTIIRRLIYILANGLCPAEDIYILCYTRSAKKVVETKIDEAVAEGILQPSAKNICVLTFDSYAAFFLLAMKEQGVIKENLENYDYNARIKLFNKYISSDDLEEIRYFIVDEIQDLVNDRAEMVLKILGGLKCGYLLAGDRCQSIYDYEADDDATIDSVEFYKRAEKQFPKDMQRFEIIGNRRQSEELAKKAAEMRDVLLNKSFSEQNIYAGNMVLQYSAKTNIETYIKTLSHTPSLSTAILCRSNGEAEYISGLLCDKGIAHTLNRGVNNAAPLPRWLADVFWDHCCETINKKTFSERFAFRCVTNLDADNIWEIMCKLTNANDKTEIYVPKLINALAVANNIPSEFYGEAPKLTVSTIHKAKGSEFDRVILIESDLSSSSDSAEEARIRYVALTRPKTQFVTMKKRTRYFKRTLTGRVIETGLHNMYNTRNRYCKSITVGLAGDVDTCSFVSGDISAALDLQEYIINNIQLYDKVSAKRAAARNVYEIYHKGRLIGTFSRKMTAEIDSGISSTDYKYRLPDHLEDIYVSGITTEILRQFDSGIPLEYQKSKICFGIQMTGLAKLVFEKK